MNDNVGKTFLFHGLMIYLGRVVEETPLGYVIKEASWMGDMGVRFHILLEKGIQPKTEVEVAPPDRRVLIPRGGFAAVEWMHPLPTPKDNK